MRGNGSMRWPQTAPMKRGEIWWVEFDPSIGSEIRKTRPAVIISNDAANRHLTRVMVMPLTSNVDRVYPGETIVTIAGRQGAGRQSVSRQGKAMADQIMAADKRRLKEQLGSLERSDMAAIEEAIKLHFGMTR
jgi:mRNA interferase MazF